MKTVKWKHLFLLVLVSVVGFLFIEIGVSIIRGYGFFWSLGHLKSPLSSTFDDARRIIEYVDKEWDWEKNSETFPSAEHIVQAAPYLDHLEMSEIQPYREFNIWVIQSRSNNNQYLYSPLSAIIDVSLTRRVGSDRSYRKILFCNKAKWEGPEGQYHSYKKYPRFVQKDLGIEKWGCVKTSVSYSAVPSEFPPVPGALVVFDDHLSPDKVLYPSEVLPALKAIYPNVEVPDELILSPSSE